MNKELILKKEKDFDCVQMKNDIQAKIYKHIKDMTFAEQKEFMRKVISGELQLN